MFGVTETRLAPHSREVGRRFLPVGLRFILLSPDLIYARRRVGGRGRR